MAYVTVHKDLTNIKAMLPFFLFAMYERNGQPLEVFLKHMVQAVLSGVDR